MSIQRNDTSKCDQGATTPLHLATHASVLERSGAYFADSKPQSCEFVRDTKAVDKLRQLLDSYP
jgi:hypothetical protein